MESEPGRGSEFTISLRFPVGEAKTGQMSPVSKSSDFTGKNLLVVEDNELNLEIASMLLAEAGFEVDTAGNGKVAVEKVDATSADRYDLILMAFRCRRWTAMKRPAESVRSRMKRRQRSPLCP